MKRMMVVFFGLAGLLYVSGCATVTRSSKDTLVIETNPPGAEVKLSNGQTGETPCSFKLPRKEALIVKIEKLGYVPVEANITPQVSGAGGAGMAGNVCLGGLIGAAVDAGSGAMNDLKPNPVSVNLEKIGGAETEPVIREKSLSEKLEELNELKEKGMVTEDEYLQLKAKILDST